MWQKILISFTLVSMIIGGIVAYANVAYYPMDKGVQLDEKVSNLDKQINAKLDRALILLEAQK